MAKFVFFQNREDRAFLILCLFLAIVALTGGGSRSDIQSLVLLRPLAVGVAAYGLLTLSQAEFTRYSALLKSAAALFILCALYIVPLPPGLWSSLPSHALVAQVDRLAGLDNVWRPLALAPDEARNTLLSLFVPLAVLLLGVQLGVRRQVHIAWFVAILLLCSVFMGALQLIAPGSDALYFYRVTNKGMAVGLFANRNHHAVMLACLMLFIAFAASTTAKVLRDERQRVGLALAVGVFFVLPVLVLSGSRAGLLTLIMALAMCPLLYAVQDNRPRKAASLLAQRRWWLAGGAVAFVIVAIIGVMALGSDTWLAKRAQTSMLEDSRLNLWIGTLELLPTYMPLGAGPGSFVDVYKAFEPLDSLSQQYANHVHNDWLEIVLNYGVLGVGLLVLAIVFWVRRARVALGAGTGDTALLQRLGVGILLIVAVASFVDYPIRVPMVASVATMSAIWAAMVGSPDRGRRQR